MDIKKLGLLIMDRSVKFLGFINVSVSAKHLIEWKGSFVQK